MLKFLASSLFHLIIFFDKILKIFKIGSFADFLFNKIQSDKYSNFSVVKIGDKKLKIISNNGLLKLRVDTFFTKEPETLNWINQFDQKFKSFWDIGANVGLYSLYASIKHPSKEIVCFEPSFNNLKVLSENISINNLENHIKLFQIGLGDKKKDSFYMMNESSSVEGSAHNCFGGDLDYKGDKFISKKKYQIYGTSVDEIIYNKILIPPDYIKIDVDGLEHVVLNGAKKLISQNFVREILIEINEDYSEQYNKLIFLMKDNNFEIRSKTQIDQNQKLLNYVFAKKV